MADDLSEYSRLATDLGLHSELRVSIGPDVIAELRRLCLDVAHEFPQAVFFAGKLIFEAELEGFISRFLHDSHRARVAEVSASAGPEPDDPAGAGYTVGGTERSRDGRRE